MTHPDPAPSPTSYRAVRVRRLAQRAERAEAKGHFALAARIYEKIAREMGTDAAAPLIIAEDGYCG